VTPRTVKAHANSDDAPNARAGRTRTARDRGRGSRTCHGDVELPSSAPRRQARPVVRQNLPPRRHISATQRAYGGERRLVVPGGPGEPAMRFTRAPREVIDDASKDGVGRAGCRRAERGGWRGPHAAREGGEAAARLERGMAARSEPERYAARSRRHGRGVGRNGARWLWRPRRRRRWNGRWNGWWLGPRRHGWTWRRP